MAKATMVLAQAPGAPEGNIEDRIEIALCLTSQGRLDAAAFDARTEPWIARHIRPDGRERRREVVRVAEGWGLRGIEGDDAPLRPLEIGLIRPGELVTLRQPDGENWVYRIVALEQDEPAGA